MPEEPKPAVTVDVTERVPCAWVGPSSRVLIDGRVWQFDLVHLTTSIVRALQRESPIRIGPAEASTSIGSEEDAE